MIKIQLIKIQLQRFSWKGGRACLPTYNVTGDVAGKLWYETAWVMDSGSAILCTSCSMIVTHIMAHQLRFLVFVQHSWCIPEAHLLLLPRISVYAVMMCMLVHL